MDRLRVGSFITGGRFVPSLDLNDGSQFALVRDTLTFTPPERKQQYSSAGRRYGGSSLSAETHDNGQVSAEWYINAGTGVADDSIKLLESLLLQVEMLSAGRFIEWRSDGATYPIYYEIAGPASWESMYRWIEFQGNKTLHVKAGWKVSPLVQGAPMEVLEDFTPRGTVQYTNLITNPSFENDLNNWSQSSYQPVNGIRNPSLETNNTDWNAFSSSGTPTFTRVTTDGWQGTSCAENATVTALASGSVQLLISDNLGTGLAVAPGDVVFLSIAVKAQAAAAAGGNITLVARTDTAAGANLGSFAVTGGRDSIASPVVGRWYVLSGWYTVPAGTTAQVTPQAVYNLPATAGNYTLRADAAFAAKVDNTSVALDYFDGSLPGATWNGTAHASQSTANRLVNLIKNPSFEVDASNWTPVTAQTTISRVTTDAKYGSACLQVARGTGPYTDPYVAQGHSIKAVPGVTYTFSVWVKPSTTSKDAAAPDRSIGLYDGITFTSVPMTTLTAGSWQKVSAQITVAANSIDTLECRLYNSQASGVVLYDGIQLTATPAALDYFDGATYGGSWFGTANASESILTSLSRTSDGSLAVRVGTYVARLAGRTSGASTVTLGSALGGSYTPVTPGESLAGRISARVSALSGTAIMGIEFFAASGAYMTGSYVSTSSLGDWSPTIVATVPANAYFARLYFGSSYTPGVFDAYVDAALLVRASAAPAYFDGDTTGSVWDGPRHASTSTQYVAGTDTLSDFTTTNGNPGIANGQLYAKDANEIWNAYTRRGYTYSDVQVTLKYTTGATPAATAFTRLSARWKNSSNYLFAGISGNGGFNIYKTAGGADTSLAAGSAGALAANTTYWARFRLEGNTLYFEHWATQPTPMGTPTASVSTTLTGTDIAQFGIGVEGLVGMRNSASGDLNMRWDDFTVEPYVYRNQTLPNTLQLGGLIPGNAPALADISITPSGGAAVPVFGLMGWAQRPGNVGVASNPFGLFEAESGGSLTGWTVTADASFRGGSGLKQTVIAGAAVATSAGFTIDPSLLNADDFAQNGEVQVEVWARMFLPHNGDLYGYVTTSARPNAGTAYGAERYTLEYGPSGKLAIGATVGGGLTFMRLGTLTLTGDPLRPVTWQLRVQYTGVATNAATVGLDYLVLVPANRRACSPTAKAAGATYPNFVPTTAETTKVIRSDLSGALCQPPNNPFPDAGFGGQIIQLPSGSTDLLVKLSSIVPDDPTFPATTEQLAHSATVKVSPTPRWFFARGS